MLKALLSYKRQEVVKNKIIMKKKKEKIFPPNAKTSELTCQNPKCGQVFMAHRSDARYCSGRCRKQMSLKNTAEKKERREQEKKKNEEELNSMRTMLRSVSRTPLQKTEAESTNKIPEFKRVFKYKEPTTAQNLSDEKKDRSMIVMGAVLFACTALIYIAAKV